MKGKEKGNTKQTIKENKHQSQNIKMWVSK